MTKIYVLLLSCSLLSVKLFAAKDIEWKLGLDWKSTLTPLSSPSYKIAEMVKHMSNGKFIIKIDGAEKHQSSDNLLEMVQDNTYNIIHTNSKQWKDKEINTIWFSGIPLGMTRKEQYSWFYYGDGQKYMSAVYNKFNLLAFPGGDLGTQMGGWFKKEIHNSADFKGLNVNTQGITNEILSMYDVNHKNIPSSKINEAFLNNQLDIISGTSPSMDIKMGFHKVAPYYYTSWNKPASQTQFLINKSAYKKLPFQYQTILKTAIKTASHELYYENFYESLKAWEKIQTDFPNIKIKTLPKNVLEDLKRSKELIFQQYSKENKLFQEIYNNQKEFISKARKWSQLEEYSYLKSLNELNKKQ